MTTQSIVCGTCAAEVPDRRLSCPSCGDLLASVAGGRRPTGVRVGASTGAAVHDDPVHSDNRDNSDDNRVDDGLNGATPEPTVAARAIEVAVPPTAPTVAPTWPATAPGAYVPPPPTPRTEPAVPARAWGGYAATDTTLGLRASTNGAPAASSGLAAATDTPAVGSSAKSEAVRIDEFVGWVSVAGSALSAVGFLLPWSSTVIGSTGGGYFDRWGLASPGHVIVVLGVLLVLALALVRNPIPVWVRVGLPGLGLGALLVGLVWPYLIGPLGSGPGVLIVVVGAVQLCVAGVVAVAADRHVGLDRPV